MCFLANQKLFIFCGDDFCGDDFCGAYFCGGFCDDDFCGGFCDDDFCDDDVLQCLTTKMRCCWICFLRERVPVRFFVLLI